MERVGFITYKGVTILKVDLSRAKDVDENIAVLNEAREVIRTQPPRSVLLLTDVTKASFNPKGIAALKDWSAANTPFVKASAVLGITGIYRIIYEAVVKLVGREIVCFDVEEQALDWLVNR